MKVGYARVSTKDQLLPRTMRRRSQKDRYS